jgi:hypothetical protein
MFVSKENANLIFSDFNQLHQTESFSEAGNRLADQIYMTLLQ